MFSKKPPEASRQRVDVHDTLSSDATKSRKRNKTGLWDSSGLSFAENIKKTALLSTHETGIPPLNTRERNKTVLSSSEVRASDLEHGGSWVRIPSGAQIFLCPLMVDSLHLPLFPL